MQNACVDDAPLCVNMVFTEEVDYVGWEDRPAGPVEIRRLENGVILIDILSKDHGDSLYEAAVPYLLDGADAGEFGVWLEGHPEADAELVRAGIITLTGRVFN